MLNVSQINAKSSALHIYEDDYKIIWAISAFGAGLIGVFLLNITFSLDAFFFKIPVILISLSLFSFSFYAAFKAAEDLYEIILHVEEQDLVVSIAKKNEIIKSERFNLYSIETLMIEPKIKPNENEAAYDYTTNYYLTLELNSETHYRQLININDNVIFAVKLEDAERVAQYILGFNPAVEVESTELRYFSNETL